MKIKENFGCIIPILLFCLIIIWIRWSDNNDDIQREENNIIQKQIDSIPDGMLKIKMLNILYERKGLYTNEKLLTLGRIIFEYENLNNLDSALTSLKRYEKIYTKSLFTTTHEADIRYKMGDTIIAQELLKNVIIKNVQYKSMNWCNKTFQRLINCNRGAEYSRYFDYLYNVFCQLNALYYYRTITHNIENNINITLSFLKQINELDNIISKYLSFEQKYRNDVDNSDIERKNLLMNHLKYGDYKSISPFKYDIVDMLYKSRANVVDDLIIEIDSIYGKLKAKQILSENLNAILSTNFTDLLFIKAYKKYIGMDNSFPTKTTYAQYKLFPKKGYKFLTLAIPSTAFNSSSALISQDIYESFVVLRCNDWSICDSSLFTPNTISKYKGSSKNIVMLRSDYKTDTISILDDIIGAFLNYVIVPEPVY